MKIINFKTKEQFKYKRKVLIKNLILNIFIGIHDFEKKKKQKVRFNIEVETNPNTKPSNKDFSTIVDYETLVNKIKALINKKHHELLEELAENIFRIVFQNKLVKKANIKLEKLHIIKESESVGIDITKNRL